MTEDDDAIRELAFTELWRRGIALEVLLDAGQLQWLHDFDAAPPLSSTVWLIGRQRGKSFGAIGKALDTGIKKQGAIIRYCAKTKDSAIGIVMPTWEQLIATMPKEIRPKKGRSECEWKFPSTGARFVLFGTDAGSFARGRGPKTDIQFFDECGFYQDLVGVEKALLPSLQTTGGKAIYLSTPPESLGHPYKERIDAAAANEQHVLFHHDTFYSNPRVDHDAVIAGEAARLGMSTTEFLASTYFRREYLAEVVQEESRAGFPSFTTDKQKQLVQAFELPPYFDGYTSSDVGVTHDPHAALFGVHDWKTDRLLIVDELLVPSGVTTIRQFADLVRAKEKSIYGETLWRGTITGAQDWFQEWGSLPEYVQNYAKATEPTQPYLRVADNASGAAKELTAEYQLVTLPASKHDKRLSVDATNLALQKNEIIIHPRCTNLIKQLSSASWNISKRVWIHGPGHHFDLCDTLIYMWRHLRRSRKAKLPTELPLQFKSPELLQREAAADIQRRFGALTGVFK